jgi:hypothetical protein
VAAAVAVAAAVEVAVEAAVNVAVADGAAIVSAGTVNATLATVLPLSQCHCTATLAALPLSQRNGHYHTDSTAIVSVAVALPH